MRNLISPKWILIKGCLFVFLGLLAALLLIWQHPTWQSCLLLVITVWAFCRFYYFAFYVIENYVDPNFRFSGIAACLLYLIRGGRPRSLPGRTSESRKG